MSSNDNSIYRKPSKLLHYHQLSTKQQIWLCYLAPKVTIFLIYVFHFAADSVLAYQHYRHENPMYAFITMFLMFLPSVSSSILILSNVELWPNIAKCTCDDFKWAMVKIAQHLFFPVWAMNRFAEQIFWCIEALRSNGMDQEKCLKNAEKRSVFELYLFLQAYLQAAPQLLFQFHLIVRQPHDFNKQTVDMQVMCIIMSAIKMALTTSAYQRYKTQKIAGRSYPWSKRQPLIKEVYRNRNSLAECDQDVQPDESDLRPVSERRNSGLSLTSSQFEMQEASKSSTFVVPTALKTITIYGLTEDDAVAKVVSFFWWFSFILPRMLCLSLFCFFYPSQAIWLYTFHYIFTLAFLLYDAHISNIPYFQAFFVLFLGFVFMFCLIEFKIKFKKVRLIYFGFFILVYAENIVMTCVWYFTEDEDTWWYKYSMYVIFISLSFSLVSMLLYKRKLRAKKVIVQQSVVPADSSVI